MAYTPHTIPVSVGSSNDWALAFAVAARTAEHEPYRYRVHKQGDGRWHVSVMVPVITAPNAGTSEP